MAHNSACKGKPGVDRAPASTDREVSSSLVTDTAKARLLAAAGLGSRLMASYVVAGGINHVDGKNLPSRQAVADITADLLRLLFPGFFDEKPIHSSEIGEVTSALLNSVLVRLGTEIGKSLEYAPAGGRAVDSRTDSAHALTLDFLASLPRVRELLQTDTEAAYNGDPAAFSQDEVIVAYPFVEAIAVQRLATNCTSPTFRSYPVS